MKIRSIKPDEFEECLDLLDRSFANTPRDHFKRCFWGDPWYKPEYTRVCQVDGVLASVVQIVRREVRMGCSTLTLGGIANVGTLPEYRGRGYSTAALESAVKVMSREGMDFSILLTGIHAFYERLGWATVETQHGVARPKARLPRRSFPYRVRPYRDEDAPAVVDVCNEFNSCVSLSVVRTVDYWRGYAVNPESTSLDKWVAEADGRVIAYLLGHSFRESYGLSEMCCRQGNEDGLLALAREARSRARETRAKELVYRLPDVPAIRSAIESVAVPFTPRPYRSVMFRVIDLRSMFERILPELERRSRQEDARGAVTVSTEFGDITLDVAPGTVRLSPQPAAARIELTQPQLFPLMFGLRDPWELLPDAPGASTLAALFARQPAVLYVADMF